LLLRTGIKGRKAWHITAYGGELVVMQKIWEWAKERLTTEEIKMKCYYAQTMRDGTRGIIQHIGAN